MRTSNPTLNDKTFQDYGVYDLSKQRMTVNGAVNKTAFLTLLVLLAASYTWGLVFKPGGAGIDQAIPLMGLGVIAGFIVAMVTIFKKEWSPVTAPIYAILEGLALGGVSALFETQKRYHGIAFEAVALTLGVLFCMLGAYRTGLIKATEQFKLGVIAATGGICLVYIVSLLLGLFGIHVPFIYSSGLIGIGFSLFVVVIAALNLVLDFDLIETGAQQGAPKYMEWYAAFSLLVTLVWLYLEILRLLSKLRSRD